MMFFGMFNVFSLRNNVNVAIVAMVNYTQEFQDDINGSELCPDHGASKIDESPSVNQLLLHRDISMYVSRHKV